MNHLSLFSGIGGIDLAAEWAGFTTVAFCEQNDYCQKVLAKHWPGVPIYDDIRTLSAESLGCPRITLLSGGFPCQPYSHAGKRMGNEDDRALWPEMFRLVKEIQPDWVCAENVPGIIDMALDGVISDLETADYETGVLVLPACAVGAWHIRQRVFILAHNGKINRHRRVCGTYRESKTGSRVPEERGKDREFSQVGAKVVAGLPSIAQRWWVEPGVVRMVHGIPHRVDRLGALGNAVVPQQVYPILKAIADYELSEKEYSHGRLEQ